MIVRAEGRGENDDPCLLILPPLTRGLKTSVLLLEAGDRKGRSQRRNIPSHTVFPHSPGVAIEEGLAVSTVRRQEPGFDA